MIDRGLRSTVKKRTPCNDLSDHRSETNEIYFLFFLIRLQVRIAVFMQVNVFKYIER